MDSHHHLDRFHAETAHIAALAGSRDLDLPVPCCPGLTAREVVRHLGSLYRRIAEWVHTQVPPETWEREPGDGDVVPWFQASAETLYAELRGHHPEDPCDTWWPYDRTVGFWWRRMAHETTVHRADVESAYGPIGPIDPQLAADGVDEVLTLFLGYRPTADAVVGNEEVIGVAAGPHLWRVALRRNFVDVSRELPDDADAIVSGEPAAVYLWLWGRRSDDAVLIRGDRGAAATLRAALSRATQ